MAAMTDHKELTLEELRDIAQSLGIIWHFDDTNQRYVFQKPNQPLRAMVKNMADEKVALQSMLGITMMPLGCKGCAKRKARLHLFNEGLALKIQRLKERIFSKKCAQCGEDR